MSIEFKLGARDGDAQFWFHNEFSQLGRKCVNFTVVQEFLN